MLQTVLVISPGVLPLPPVMGGAVENMITRLHAYLAKSYVMEYVSVRAPQHHQSNTYGLDGALIHYIDSINPLEDFTFQNQFELHESNKWSNYKDFCIHIALTRNPDIIHIHNEAYLVPYLKRALPKAKIILHVNDEVVTRMKSGDLQLLSETCDLILACSGYISREISRVYKANKLDFPQMNVFYNFVDLKEYNPSKISSERVAELRKKLEIKEGPVVLFVGRLIEQKGPHLALRAFRRIAETIPDVQLVFVGAPWYSQENKSPFVTYIQTEAKPIADRLHFTGYVDHTQMPSYYAMADIVCVPSIWDDPSPFVAYEAQAMGKPVVSSTRGGIPEIVEDFVTGRCIDVFNTPLFAQILRDWLNDSKTASTLGIKGRQRIIKLFDLANAEKQMINHYNKILEK